MICTSASWSPSHRTLGARPAIAVLVALLVTLPGAAAPGAPLSLVRDINAVYTPEQSSSPRAITVVDNVAFFVAGDVDHGVELWRTDGTTLGTALVKDIQPGPGGSSPSALAAAGGALFFAVGRELWRSDGTAEGTLLVKDFDAEGAAPKALAGAADGTLFFAVGTRLWRSDGTPDGTTKVLDAKSYRSSAAEIVQIAAASDRVYFVSSEWKRPNVITHSVWESDGTSDGTRSIWEEGSGFYTAPAHVKSLMPLGAGLLFVVGLRGLYYYDPAAPWPVMLSDSEERPAVWRGKIWFGTMGGDLWQSDGTQVGKTHVIDTTPAEVTKYDRILALTVAGDRLFFIGANPQAGPGLLWQSDGKAEGTAPIPGSPMPHSSMTELDGRLLFVAPHADAGGTRWALWTSDGTSAGTQVVQSFAPIDTNTAPDGLTAFGDQLLFAADDGLHGSELWSSGAAPGSAALVQDINPYRSTGSATPMKLTAFDDRLLFSADDGLHGRELWASGGTAESTAMVRDINPGLAGSSPGPMMRAGGRLLFSADDGRHGRELWSTDGTPAHTALVRDISPGVGGIEPDLFATLGDKVIFRAPGDDGRLALWASDGTPEGTELIQAFTMPIYTGLILITYPLVVEDRLYFSVIAGVSSDLWVTDGTAEGTTALTYGAGGQSMPALFAGKIFFGACISSGCGLWRSDGTREGTWRVALTDGPIDSLTPAAGRLFFVSSQQDRNQLWVSDGTPDGTSVLCDDASVPSCWMMGHLTATRGGLIFTTLDPKFRQVLWASDGTAAGTRPITYVTVRPSLSEPLFVDEHGEALFLGEDTRSEVTWPPAPSDPSPGPDLWRSDGTASGTFKVMHLGSGPSTAMNGPFTLYQRRFNSTLFTIADWQTGRIDLWRTDGTTRGTLKITSFSSLVTEIRQTPIQIVGDKVFFGASDSGHGDELWTLSEADLRHAVALPLVAPGGRR